MAGSHTNRTTQSNTDETHTAVNNQDLSSNTTVNDTKNIRNYDIVHGNDIGGGYNTFNGLTNTGTQVFKLQELNLSQPRLVAYQFTRDPTILTRDVRITPGTA